MKTTRELVILTIGCLLTAFGVNDLVIPAHLMSGGLTGITIILYHYLRFPVGTSYFVLNIPLLILAYRYIGRKFAVYTVFSVIALSGFLSLVHIHAYSHDLLLSAIFGGIVTGAGGAMILRVGGSSGGVDVVVRILARLKNANMGRLNLIINGLIIVVSAFLFDVQTAMYTLISIYTGAKMYEVLLNHVDRISVIVVTERGHEISDRIVESMRRGVTMWDASGAFTRHGKKVLLCVIVNVQFPELRHIIEDEDPDAFIAIVPTQRVVGQFHQVW